MNFNFSKREKTIFHFLIGILVIYIMYVTLYDFFWGNLLDLKEKIQNAEQRLSEESSLVKTLSSRVQGQGPRLDLFRQTESDGSIRSRMLAALQELSNHDNVQIVDMKPSPVRVQDFYKEFPVSVKLEGDFVHIMKFFFEAESEEYGFRIQEFRFSRSFSRKSNLQCQVVLSRIFLNS